MKISPVSSFNIYKSNNFIPAKQEQNSKQSVQNKVSYFDIPFTSDLDYGAKIRDSYASLIKAKNEVEKVSGHAFELTRHVEHVIEDVTNLLNDAKESGISSYYNDENVLQREVVFNNSSPVMMREYKNGEEFRKTDIYPDGSMKIKDSSKRELIFTNPDGSLSRFEKSYSSDYPKTSEYIDSDGSRFRYTKIVKQNKMNTKTSSFLYGMDVDEPKIKITYLKNIAGRDYLHPKSCDYVITLEKDIQSDYGFLPVTFMRGVQKSPAGTSYTARNALFYNFAGVLSDYSSINSRIVAQEPVSYNEGIKFRTGTDFSLYDDLESKIVMLNKDGEFYQMTL